MCGFVSACCVCVFLNMCLYVCVFSYPHLYRRHSAAPLRPAYLFVLQFSLICSLCGGHAHFAAVTHSHTLAHTLGGRSARTQPVSRTYAAICPFLHGKAGMSNFTCSQTLSADYECRFSFMPDMNGSGRVTRSLASVSARATAAVGNRDC